MAEVIVTAIDDGRRFRMEKGMWSDVYDIDELDRQLTFYRRWAKKRPEIYQPTVDALEAFKAEREKT